MSKSTYSKTHDTQPYSTNSAVVGLVPTVLYLPFRSDLFQLQ